MSALADNQAAEPDDNPFFDTGTYVIRQSEPSSTPTTVRFQITGDADFELSDFTLSTELGENLTNLGDGLYSVDIPASIGDTPITEIDIILNPVSDDIFEDDEQATLTLVDINGVDVPGTVDGDPEVMLDTIDQSATIQIDGDDEGLLQVTSDPANGGVPIGAEGGNNGRFVFLLRDRAAPTTPGDSDTSTTIDFAIDFSSFGDATFGADYTLALPAGFDPMLFNLVVNDPVGSVVTGSIDIPANGSSAELEVVVINDLATENTEDVTLTITGSSGNTDISVDSTMDTAVVQIEDDADGLFVNIEPVVRDSGDSFASEDGQIGQFRLFLVDNNGNAVTLPAGSTIGNGLTFQIAASGDATRGSDFTTVDLVVEINEGESDAFLSITPIDDGTPEDLEDVTLTIISIRDSNGTVLLEAGDPADPEEFGQLQNPEGGSNGERIGIGRLDGEDTASINIVDNDPVVIAAPVVSGVYVRGTGFNSDFIDIADDGVMNGTGHGFSITDLDRTLPFFGVNQFVLRV